MALMLLDHSLFPLGRKHRNPFFGAGRIEIQGSLTASIVPMSELALSKN
jgi:hypothetical protein